jgi:hypothetical protein
LLIHEVFSWEGTASQLAKKTHSHHGTAFSRADQAAENAGFGPWGSCSHNRIGVCENWMLSFFLIAVHQ